MFDPMSRIPEPPVLSHARQSLARARSGVSALRTRLGEADARSLDLGLAALVDSFASLEAATDGQLAQCWSQFFGCYDRLLALIRAFDKSPAGDGD
jgi:hypothetical protein